MTTILLLSLLVLIAVGSGTVIYALNHAAEGLEDESGFHFADGRARRDANAQIKCLGSRSTPTFPAGLPTA